MFSLAHALRYWQNCSVPLRVINVFTISNYGPRAVARHSSTDGSLSWLRKLEDAKAIQFASNAAQVRDLNQLDAPLQYQIGVSAVSGPGARAPSQQDVEHLSQILRPLLRTSRVVAPLGLGNHVNHLAVKRAALRCVHSDRLAFYEDLPYATWATGTEWRERLQEASANGNVHLRPLFIRSDKGVRWKRQAAQLYQTQIGVKEATAIADFARQYRGRERLWIPRHSADWSRH